jgi:hypothetical protein
MQPTIHCNKKPDIEAVNVRVFLLMNCGLHFLFRRAHYSSKSPCIGTITTQRGRPQTNYGCPDRGAGQERETQKFGDKTTFISADTMGLPNFCTSQAATTTSGLVAPRSMPVVQRGREVV